MNNFYISKLVVAGEIVQPAMVEFNAGLNIVIGPSNSGKSLILDCIDYVLGYEYTKNDQYYRLDGMKEKYGYDTIEVYIKTEHGQIILTRQLHSPSILIDSTDPHHESGQYSVSHTAKKNINDFLLSLLGIDKKVMILSSIKGKTQRLTWRTFHFMFFIKQDFIARSTSLLINPTAPQTSQTSGPASLLYLLTGQDASFVDNDTDVNRSIKNEAIMKYINQKLFDLERELKSLPPDDGAPYQKILDDAASKAAQHFSITTKESQLISKQIQEIDRKLAEHYVVHDQFEALRSQYQTDVERMAFIVEGELITKGIQGTGGINDTVARDTGDTGDTRDFDRTPNIMVTGGLINRPFEAYNNAAAANNFMACNNLITHVPLTCPFCGGKYIPHDEPSYIESVRANLSRIKKHMSELNVADNDVLEQIENLKKEKERLEQHLIKSEFFESDREAVSMLINLNACSTRLRGMGSKTQIEKERNRYRQDLLNYQRQKDKIQKTYYIREKFPAEIILELEDLIISLLREFKCPHSNSAHYNIETWDIEFGSVNKTGIMGGGYSGIVNIAHALALKKLLSEHRSPTLNMLMIDSPLTSLSETDGIDDNKSIRTAFMKYLIEHRRDGQVIIFEHKDRMPAFIEKLCPNFQDYQDEFFSIIQFSHNLRHGRPGLFPGVADDGR